MSKKSKKKYPKGVSHIKLGIVRRLTGRLLFRIFLNFKGKAKGSRVTGNLNSISPPKK
jgi:hypothetical protein